MRPALDSPSQHKAGIFLLLIGFILFTYRTIPTIIPTHIQLSARPQWVMSSCMIFPVRHARRQHRQHNHRWNRASMKTRSNVKRSGAMAAPSGAVTGMRVTATGKPASRHASWVTAGRVIVFLEIRCTHTRTHLARQGWYLNWRNFTPTHGMRLIADYRTKQETCT